MMLHVIRLSLYLFIFISNIIKNVTSMISLLFPDIELIDYIDYNTNTIIYKFIYDLNGNHVIDRNIEILLTSNDLIKPWDINDITCEIISYYNNQSIFIPINMNESIFVNRDNQSNEQLEIDDNDIHTNIESTNIKQLQLYYIFQPGIYKIIFHSIQQQQYLFYESLDLNLQFKYIFQPATHVYLLKEGFNDNVVIHNLYVGKYNIYIINLLIRFCIIYFLYTYIL